MRIAIAKSATVFRHKQPIAMHHWLHALVVLPDPFWSTNIGLSGQKCMWPTIGLGRTNFGQVGPISDAKNGPGRLNLVD